MRANHQGADGRDDLRRQAKRPITRLAGPYGHPIHPMLIPVPIGAWVASFVFDLASRATAEPQVFATGAFWLVGLGILGALVAALFGFMDLLTIPRGTRAFTNGIWHMSLNLTVTALFVVSFFLRQGTLEGPVPPGIVWLSVVALLLLSVSGWIGGRLAYHYGVRVADEAEQSQGFEQPRKAA